MKITLIGQDMPSLLPSLLADLLFAQKQPADVCLEERNPAMQDVLARYADAVMARADLGGRVTVDGNRRALLSGADCVIYAGDYMAASRFKMDYQALSGAEDNPDDPGLTDQARVNGGLGGLLHTLRQGEVILDLCQVMREVCPGALVITLGQPVARTVALFEGQGFRTYGLGASPLRGANGLEALCARQGKKLDQVQAQMAGLPGFAWLLSLRDAASGTDLLPAVRDMAATEGLGRLTRRWLDWYDAVAVGDVTSHAQFMAQQDDYIPERDPELSETVEKRKERILNMNTVAEKGLTSQGAEQGIGEGEMAQWLLLSKAPAIRPISLAVALLTGSNLDMPGVSRRNRGEITNLPREAIIESDLTLQSGAELKHALRLPAPLAEACMDIDEANRLAAQAAAGDRSALREYIEIDPALEGLDRLYCQQLADALIGLHADILTRFTPDDDD